MAESGSVIFVGAGCGPGLITVAGLKAVQSADTILYDDLIDDNLLEQAAEDCRKIYAGKRSGRKSTPQEEINAILIQEAREGRQVLRLKGGDSFVFGRGGEEMLALQKAGISYRVIPGVTSAIAVPESLGIPVTHRGVSRSFTVVTGHTATEDTSEEKRRYASLAAIDGTLVFLMGLSNAGHISEGLIAGGKDPETPAAILSRGYASDATRIDGTLQNLGDMTQEAKSPAIIVVGDVAGFHLEPYTESAESFMTAMTSDQALLKLRKRKISEQNAERNVQTDQLTGVSVSVCGTESFTKRVAHSLNQLGAEIARYAYLKTVPLPENMPAQISENAWLVFTSANGVNIFFAQLAEQNAIPTKVHFACIGRSTAAALRAYGYEANLIPTEYTAACLGRELAGMIRAEAMIHKSVSQTKANRSCRELEESAFPPVFLLRAENGSPDLPRELDKAGIPYDDYPVYRTVVDETALPTEIEHRWLIFGSANGVRTFFQYGCDPGNAHVLCVGPVTGREAARCFKKAGWNNPIAAAREHSLDGIVKMLLKLEQGSRLP